MMWQRKDVVFFLLTKRPERVLKCLPPDWGDGWDNVFFNVTCENQRRADERIPVLLELPFKHKSIMCAPYIGPVSIKPWLSTGQIEQVICGGENYGGARPCHFDWVKSLYDECVSADIRFCFIETGTQFVKDGRLYRVDSKQTQSRMIKEWAPSLYTYRDKFFKSSDATVEMFGKAGLIAFAVGLLLGILLVVTKKDGIRPNGNPQTLCATTGKPPQ